ncbi:MAG: hypothetical protein ACTSRX_05665 [Promethearchaeota archaeon]
MAQIQTQNYASNIQSAEQKFAQAANSLTMKISKALSVMKQKVSEWTSSSSSGSSLLTESLMIQKAKDRDLVKYGDSASHRAFSYF